MGLHLRAAPRALGRAASRGGAGRAMKSGTGHPSALRRARGGAFRTWKLLRLSPRPRRPPASTTSGASRWGCWSAPPTTC
eukprot:4678728-Alexandrium_andersonii.AAC.1